MTYGAKSITPKPKLYLVKKGKTQMSKEREKLEKQLEYMPLFVMYNGELVKVTIENYEKVTGRKLPE